MDQPRKRRTDPKTLAAISYLVDGTAKNQEHAAKLAGIYGESLSRALKLPQYQQFLSDEIRKHFRGAPAIAAARRLVTLIDAKSEDVASRIATRVLEADGILDVRERLNGPAAGVGNGPVLVVNFRQIEAPNGTPLVQLEQHQPDSRPIPAIPAADHALTEGVSDHGVADSGGSIGKRGVEKTDERANPPPRRAVETPDG